MLANRRLGYAEVHGDVKFGSMDAKDANQYRGQIVRILTGHDPSQ